MGKQNIIVNRSNMSFTSVNRLNVILKTPEFINKEIAIKMLSINFSWFNITALFGNQNISYLWNGVQFDITVKEGFYEIDDLSTYFATQMILNGHYLLNGDGNKVVYVSWSVNPTYYTTSFHVAAIPAVLPTGWSDPLGVITGTAYTPQLVIPTGTGELLGISAGTYPAAVSITDVFFDGDITPNASPVEVINIGCNLASNDLQNTNFIHSFVTSGKFGSRQHERFPEPSYYSITNTKEKFIELSFVDQENRALQIRDRGIHVELSIRDAPIPDRVG
jgi:hypothetical protein